MINSVTSNMFKKAFDDLIVPDFLSNHKPKIKQEKLWSKFYALAYITIAEALCTNNKRNWVYCEGIILTR